MQCNTESNPTAARSTTTKCRAWRNSIAPKWSWRVFQRTRASSTGRGFAPSPTRGARLSSGVWRTAPGPAGAYPNPGPTADVGTTTTHKTLRGPRGGLILARPHADLHKKFNSMVFSGTQGGPLTHVIAAKAVGFLEAVQPEFKVYPAQVVTNARVMTGVLQQR